VIASPLGSGWVSSDNRPADDDRPQVGIAGCMRESQTSTARPVEHEGFQVACCEPTTLIPIAVRPRC